MHKELRLGQNIKWSVLHLFLPEGGWVKVGEVQMKLIEFWNRMWAVDSEKRVIHVTVSFTEGGCSSYASV